MIALLTTLLALADPCGMVPPVDLADHTIVRDGVQRTYVMFADGVEVIALRPGFVGDAAEFGMLIPFPSPPSVHKSHDDLFRHIEAAIDPQPIRVRVERPSYGLPSIGAPGPVREEVRSHREEALAYDDVQVVSTEAVGVYEVAVLAAGSAAALRRWMTAHRFRFPDGMDAVADEYIAAGWVFVAVKTRVAAEDGARPRPGMRSILAKGDGRFHGYVQGMTFRFRVDEPVVPMRLSVFNGRDAHNVVYVLADEPVQIAELSKNLVRKQIPGSELRSTLTSPTRLTGDPVPPLPPDVAALLEAERRPDPWTGVFRSRIAADLTAIATGALSLDREDETKRLLEVSHDLGLSGEGLDRALAEAMDAPPGELDRMDEMWLTVVDGAFPSDVIGAENLTFERYDAPARTRLRDPLAPSPRVLTLRVDAREP